MNARLKCLITSWMVHLPGRNRIIILNLPINLYWWINWKGVPITTKQKFPIEHLQCSMQRIKIYFYNSINRLWVVRFTKRKFILIIAEFMFETHAMITTDQIKSLFSFFSFALTIFCMIDALFFCFLVASLVLWTHLYVFQSESNFLYLV